MFDCALCVAFLVAAFKGFALVIVLFALTKRNDDFYKSTGTQKLGWNNCHAVFFTSDQRVDLLAAGKELSRFGIDGSGAWLPFLVELKAKTGVIKP